MSGKIKYILLVFICIILVSGCQPKMIPHGYLSTPKQIKKSITGCWIDVSLFSDSSKNTITMISGELLAVDDNTFHILTPEARLVSLKAKGINSAKLYIFANPTIPLIGYLGLIPNIIGAVSNPGWASGFLAIGAPLFITSSVIAINNISTSNGHSFTLTYPDKNSIGDLSRFARFPQGLPPDLQKEKLHLVIK